MFGWLKKRAQIAIVNSVRTDIDRFILGLEGASAREVGGVLAIASHWRNVLEKSFGWNLDHPDMVSMQDMWAATKLNKMIREVQKQNTAMASGLMVWLHTLRAGETPEIRSRGRHMWGQLSRGLPFVEAGAEGFYGIAGLQLDIAGYDRVPANLAPREDEQRGRSVA